MLRKEHQVQSHIYTRSQHHPKYFFQAGGPHSQFSLGWVLGVIEWHLHALGISGRKPSIQCRLLSAYRAAERAGGMRFRGSRYSVIPQRCGTPCHLRSEAAGEFAAWGPGTAQPLSGEPVCQSGCGSFLLPVLCLLRSTQWCLLGRI